MEFKFDGATIPYEEGDTLASALWKADRKVIGRSMKYHRPRGVYCNTGSCANCFVNVDGTPNVPSCMTAASPSIVTSQNRIGSAKMDALSVVDKVYRKGFDPHGAFTKSNWINRRFLQAVRFMSGWGKAPKIGTPEWRGKRHELEVDELIIGAGHHGLSRANEAKGRVLLVEEMATVGGDAKWTTEPIPETRAEVWTKTLAFGIYGDTVALRRGQDLFEVKAKRITVATGQHDGMPLFAGNDAPGILSLRGAKRLVREQNGQLGKVAWHGPHGPFADALDVVVSGTVTEAKGAPVHAVRVDGTWHDVDTVICNVPGMKRIELLQQAGCQLTFQNGLTPAVDASGKTSRDDVYALFTEDP
ncbi:MAG: 2Fe-2S iron-sulfur cluster-binding protein [Thermoplasmatota archaeon]